MLKQFLKVATVTAPFVAFTVLSVLFFPLSPWFVFDKTDPSEFKTMPTKAEVIEEQIMQKLPMDYDKQHTGKERYVSPRLSKGAQHLADSMATHGWLQHSNLDQLVSEGYGVCCENVACAADWDGAYDEWRRSTKHYINMRSNTKHAGFGAAQAPNGLWYFCVIYTTNDPYWVDGF